jgi:hypothetical protein
MALTDEDMLGMAAAAKPTPYGPAPAGSYKTEADLRERIVFSPQEELQMTADRQTSENVAELQGQLKAYKNDPKKLAILQEELNLIQGGPPVTVQRASLQSNKPIGISDEMMLQQGGGPSDEDMTGLGTGETPNTYWEAVKERAMGVVRDAASVGEFLGAGLGMATGAAAGELRYLEQLYLKGKTRKEARTAELETAAAVGGALNPVTVAKHLLGYEPDPSAIDSAMEAMSKAIHSYGEKIESTEAYKIGGKPVLIAEDIDVFAQVLMAAAFGKATVGGLKTVAKAAIDAKNGTAPPLMPGKISILAKTPDEIIKGKLKETGDTAEARATYADTHLGKEPAPEAGTAEAPFRHEMPQPPTEVERLAKRAESLREMKSAFKDPDRFAARQYEASAAMEARAQELVDWAMKEGRTPEAMGADWPTQGKLVDEIINKSAEGITKKERGILEDYVKRAAAAEAPALLAGKEVPPGTPPELTPESLRASGRTAAQVVAETQLAPRAVLLGGGVEARGAAPKAAEAALFRKRQQGSIDQEHWPYVMAALAGGSTAALVAVAKYLQGNEQERSNLEQSLGLGAGLAAAGVIKGKGGTWHQEAVTRLAQPLATVMARDHWNVAMNMPDGPARVSANEAGNAASDWADRAVRNYLNKHAGTATDPIKDLRLPDGTKWEDLTDKAYASRPARQAFASKYSCG